MGWKADLTSARTSTMSTELVELNFALAPDEEDWPPFAVEGLWCQRDGDHFRLVTCPLFVKGVAVGDLVAAEVESDPSAPALLEVLSFKVLQPSDHSTVWMIAPDDELRQTLRTQLHEIGCATEGGPAALPGLVAIDLPGTVPLSQLDKILDPYREEQRIEVVFPTLRHPEMDND